LKLGIQDFKANSLRDLGGESIRGRWMLKLTLGITGLHEILGRDYRIKKPYCGPSNLVGLREEAADISACK